MSALIIDPLAVTPTPPADPFSLLDPVKEEAKRRERADRIEAAVLNGVDSLMTPEQKASRADLDAMSADKGAASRQRMTHSMFLAGETGRPVEEIDDAYDYWKTLYARQHFDGANDEGAFGTKVKELVTKRRDFRVQMQAVHESGVRDALTLEPEDFMKQASRLTDIYGSDTKLGPAEGQKLRETYLLARQQAEGKLAPLRPRARAIWNELLKGTVKTGDEEEYDPMERIVTLLEDTPDNERPMLLQLLKSQVGEDRDKLPHPFSMGMVRGFLGMAQGASDFMDIRKIDGYRRDLSETQPAVDPVLDTPDKIINRMESGQSLITPDEGGDPYRKPRRNLSPDEVKTLREYLDRQIKRHDLVNEARTIFNENVQPMDLSGFAGELRYDVGNSLGAMAPMMVPYIGGLIAQAGYSDEDYLLLRQQGADFDTAKGQSEIRGALKAGIERVAFLFNFVPTSALGKLSTMLLTNRSTPALVAGARGMAYGIGKRVALTEAVEYNEEIMQAGVPVFTAAIAGPLGIDLPQQAQLTAELERFHADGGLWRPRVFAAVAAMTLLPAGVHGVMDTVQARAEITNLLADPDYATAMGIKPDHAVIIATMLPEDRLDAYLESFPSRDTKTPEAKAAAENVARKAQEQAQWAQDQVAEAEAKGVRIIRTDAGYDVRDTTSGTTLSVATAEEASMTMRHIMLERGLLEEERFLNAADQHIEMMQPGRSIDVSTTRTTMLDELERATADKRGNDVVTIWERADQYRLSIGKEVLDRDRLNPDSRNALAEMGVFGTSVTTVREGVARSISKVMSGGNSLDLLEEQAENDYREAVHYGKVEKETMKAIIKKLETATGDQYQFVDSDLGVAEAWSRIVRLYATGTQNSKGNRITKGARGDAAAYMRERRSALRQAEAKIAGKPTGTKASDLREKRRRLREAEANGVTPGAFTKLREYYDQAKAQLGQVARLMKARDAGQLDDLETMIRQSVGLTEQDTYDSQLTKEMEATEATINPPDSWTGSMSVGQKVDAAATADMASEATDTDSEVSFSIGSRIIDAIRAQLKDPVKPAKEGPGSIIYNPDHFYRNIGPGGFRSLMNRGFVQSKNAAAYPDVSFNEGGVVAKYDRAGGQRYILEAVPDERFGIRTVENGPDIGYRHIKNGELKLADKIRVFEMQEDGTYKVVHDNIGGQALIDPAEQATAGGYSVGSRAQPEDSQEGSYSIGTKRPVASVVPDVVTTLESTWMGQDSSVDFPKRKRARNDTLNQTPNGPVPSMVSPPRVNIYNPGALLPVGLQFAGREPLVAKLVEQVTKMETWHAGDPSTAGSSLRFYSGMGDAAYDMAVGDYDAADLMLRWMSFLSPRATVPSNAAKVVGSGASAYESGFTPGVKAGTFNQIYGMDTIRQEWKRSEAFGMHLTGVDNKVRNFYLNGASELLTRAIREKAPEATILALAKKLAVSLSVSVKTRGGVEVTVDTMADIGPLQVELHRLVTSDMWDQAALGNVRAGFIHTAPGQVVTVKPRKDGHAWVDPAKGREVSLDSAEAQAVLNHHAKSGENKKKKGDETPMTWSELTWQEKESLDYDPENGTIRIFTPEDSGDTLLAAGGESPTYDISQALSGMMADIINARGGMAGKTVWTAYNVQEYRWGMEKVRNPLKANRDFSSYDEVVTSLKALSNITEDGTMLAEATAALQAELDILEANPVTKGKNDIKSYKNKVADLKEQIRNLTDLPFDASIPRARLKAAMDAAQTRGMGKGIGSMTGAEAAYAKQARQLIPFEIQSEDGGKDYKTITNRIIKRLGEDGDQDPTDTMMKHIMRPGFAYGLQGILRDAGLPITVRSARTGRGGYLATHSPNILLEVSGPRWAVKVLNEELANALEQTGGNVIRNPSMSEKMAGAKLTGVIEIPLPEGVTDDQITAMMNDIMLIQDSAGASGENFLGGYTTILDEGGQPSIAIHGGFYEGGNFSLEAADVLEQIDSAAVLHLGLGKSKITKRIVDAYKNEPSRKYKPRGRGRDNSGSQPAVGDQGGQSVPGDSIRSKAQSGLRDYFLERSKGARASSVRAQGITEEINPIANLRDDIAAAWTARTAREGGEKDAQMPARLVQFMGTADPRVALVDLSAIAVSEGLDSPALRGLGGLLWDVSQRVAMVNVGKVEVFADMPATDLRAAGQKAIETTARKLLRDNKLGTIIVGGGTITAPEGTEIFEAGGLPVMVNKARAEKDFPRDYVKQIQAKQVSATPAFRTTVEIATKQTNTFGYVVTYDTHGDISATESLDVATGDRALGKHRAAEDQAADSADASSMSVGPRRGAPAVPSTEARTAGYERRRPMINADQEESSMSIGPRAKLDAVQARLDARLEKDPVARRKIAAEAARRLRKLETDWTTERLTWKGDKIKAIPDPRSRKSLDKEQAFREAAAVERELAARGLNGDDIARSKDSKDYEMWHRFQESKHLLMERGMGEWEATALADFGASKWRKDFVATIKEVTAIAQAEGAEWRKGIDARQAKDYSPRASLLRDMRTLDAIVGALPPEIRYQVGGQIKLAGLATDEARADEIARRIDRIAPLLERHLQKEFTASLEKLLERAKPMNAKPGEKMTGKLGPEVQHLMDVVRAAYRWTAAQTEAALAALDSRLADPDITPEQQALAERERELVNLVGGWLPETADSGRLDKLGRPIFTRVADGASAAQMEVAYKAVEETYETGYQEWQAKILAKRLARQAIRDSLMIDTGKTGEAPERDAMTLADLGWTAKLRNMFLSLSSFEEVVRYVFGMDSAQGVRLVDQEREAAYAYEDAVQAMGDLVHAHFTALGGDSLAGEKIRYELSQKNKTVGKRTLSEMEIMQAALMWQQADGKRHMIGKLDENNQPIGPWNYDQQWMDEAMKQLSPQGLSTLAFIRGIYAAEYGPLNAIYRARHGVDLPQNANYAPVTVAPAQAKAGEMVDPVGGEMVDPVGGGTTTGSILTPGSLRTRSRSAIAEPDFKDALQVMLAHHKQMEHWKAYYDFAVEAQAVLGNRELGNAVESRAGAQGKLVLRKWIDVFAQGGTRDAGAALTMNVELGSMTGRAARMALVGRAGTLMIQSTQLGAALAEMPSGAYLLRLGKLMAGKMGWKAAIDSPFIQRRLAEAPPIVRQAMAGLSADNPTAIKHAVTRLGTLITGADALFTAGTYAIVLDYQLHEAAKLGLTGPAAEAYAHKAAERSVERVAQPTRAGTRSFYENTTTSPLGKLSWAFASEARQKIALAAWAAQNRKADPARAARVAMVVWGVGGLMAAVLRNAWRDLRDDDDDEVLDDKHWKLSQLVASTIAGPLTGIPAIGEALQSAIAVATGGWDSSGNLLSGLGKGVGAGMDLLGGDFLESDEPMEDVMKDAEAVLFTMGLFNDNLASADSLMHVIRDGAAVVDGLYDTDKERLMKDAANQRKLEAEETKARKAAIPKAQQEAEADQRKAKRQAQREQDAAKWRSANP